MSLERPSRVTGSGLTEGLQNLQDHEETGKVEIPTDRKDSEPETVHHSPDRQVEPLTACKLTPKGSAVNLQKTQTEQKQDDFLPKPGEKLLGRYICWTFKVNIQIGLGLCLCSGCFKPQKTGKKKKKRALVCCAELLRSASRGQCLHKEPRGSALRLVWSQWERRARVALSKPDTEDKEARVCFFKKDILLSSDHEHSESLCRNRKKLRKVRLS